MRTPPLLIAGALLALPSAAQAQRPEPICQLVNGPVEYQAAIVPLLGYGAQAAARDALGAQYTGLWLDTARQGWSVAFAPGPLDAESARAAVQARLAARFHPDQVAYLSAKLNLLPDKYSEAELEAARARAGELAQSSGFDLSWGIGCFGAGAWRVHVTRFGVKQTPEVVAETEALFAELGDKVHLEYNEGVPMPEAGAPTPPPQQQPAPQPLRLADYASVPRASRCVRGKAVGVKAARNVRSVTLSAGKRKVTARSGKRARLALKRRSTKVTVTVKLRDGRSATQQYTFTRC